MDLEMFNESNSSPLRGERCFDLVMVAQHAELTPASCLFEVGWLTAWCTGTEESGERDEESLPSWPNTETSVREYGTVQLIQIQAAHFSGLKVCLARMSTGKQRRNRFNSYDIYTVLFTKMPIKEL